MWVKCVGGISVQKSRLGDDLITVVILLVAFGDERDSLCTVTGLCSFLHFYCFFVVICTQLLVSYGWWVNVGWSSDRCAVLPYVVSDILSAIQV